MFGHSTNEYNPLGVLTAQNVDIGGGKPVSRTTYVVDQGGQVTSSTDPLGNTTNFTYDEAGRLAVTVGPAVATETGGGAPVSVRSVTTVGYNTFGETVERQDARGNVARQTYDAAGRPKTTTLPAYTPPGATTPITSSIGRTYDVLGQLTEQTDPLGKKTTYAYDQLSRLSKVTAADGGISTFTYDLLGDQLSTTDPAGAVQTATYDYLGHTVTNSAVVRQDSTNYTTTMTYGADGRLASTRSPAGVTASATYNAAGETVTATDGAGKTTRFDYDAAGRAIRTTLPDNTYTTAAYDLAGSPVGSAAYSAGGTVLATGATRVRRRRPGHRHHRRPRHHHDVRLQRRRLAHLHCPAHQHRGGGRHHRHVRLRRGRQPDPVHRRARQRVPHRLQRVEPAGVHGGAGHGEPSRRHGPARSRWRTTRPAARRRCRHPAASPSPTSTTTSATSPSSPAPGPTRRPSTRRSTTTWPGG